MSSLWTWEIISVLLALLLTGAWAWISGRRRNRMSGVIFWAVTLGLSGALVSCGILLDNWSRWKSRDDSIASSIAAAPPTNVKRIDNGDKIIYDIKDPYPGVLNLRMVRRPFEIDYYQINGFFHGLLISLAACVIRYVAIRSLGKRAIEGHCFSCGYDLTGNESGVCTECGEHIPDTI